MSNSVNLTSKEWCDLVFEGKNKEFGAYVMRQNSAKRHNLAFMWIIIGFIACIVLYFGVSKYLDMKAEEAREALLKQQQETIVNQMSEEESEEEVEDIKQEEQQEPEEVQEAQQQVTELAIVPDKEVTQPPQLTTETQKNEADISAQNVEGQLGGLVSDIKPQEAPKPAAVVEQKVQVEKPVEETKVFTSVEQMPQFPGGDAALLRYIGSHLQYPAMAQEQGIQGKCVLQFVVTKTGSVGEVKVVRSLSPDCDNEAKRVVRGLPKFTPGKQNGQAVNVWYTLPVTSKVQN